MPSRRHTREIVRAVESNGGKVLYVEKNKHLKVYCRFPNWSGPLSFSHTPRRDTNYKMYYYMVKHALAKKVLDKNPIPC